VTTGTFDMSSTTFRGADIVMRTLQRG